MDKSRIPALAIAMMLTASMTGHAQVRVVAKPVEEVVVDQTVRAPARVTALAEPTVAAQVSATVQKAPLEPGDTVAQGDLIIRLDPTEYAIALQRARAEVATLEAQIEQAQLRLDRAERLSESAFISADDLLERETTLAVRKAQKAGAQAAVEQAELNLARTTIVAPFDAVVLERLADEGALVVPGSPLIRLVSKDRLEVRADVPASRAAGLAAASKADFVTKSKQRFAVKLQSVVPRIDVATGNQLARLTFVDTMALVGDSGDIVWQAGTNRIPYQYIEQRGARFGVFVVDGTSARFVPLAHVEEGRPAAHQLPSGALIVVEGQSRLTDGQTIDVATP